MNPNWSEYEKLVMYRLDTLDSNMVDLKKAQDDTRNEVTKLQVKASIWGVLGGMVSGAVGFFFNQKGN